MDVDERVVEAIERLMMEAVGVTTVALGQASPNLELSFPQWRALVVVGAVDDGIRIGEIAARIGSAAPATSRLVRRLERRGLVSSERDEADRRATRVRLTDAGEEIRTALIERRRALVRQAISDTAVPLAAGLRPGLEQIGRALGRYA
jgi:DNA-binding MarR family transcriptional regulator